MSDEAGDSGEWKVQRDHDGWLPLVEASMELGMIYQNAYDYMMRKRLVGQKTRRKFWGNRKGWYVTVPSVEKLKRELLASAA